MKQTVKTVVLCCVCFGVTHAVHAQSLQSELALLASDHPVIRSAESEVEAAKQGVEASFSPFLPSVDVRGQLGWENVRSPVFDATPEGEFNGEVREGNAAITQNIWDGGAKYANRRGAKFQQSSSEAGLTAARQRIFFDAASAYVNVLRQSRLLSLSNQDAENIRTQLDLEDERVARGAGIEVDVLQAKSRLQQALERRVAIIGALDSAQARYLQVFGTAATPDSMVMPPTPGEVPGSLEDALAMAVSNNPLLASAQTQVDIARSQKDAVAAEYQPSLDFILEAGVEEDFNGTPGTRKDYSGRFQASWNLFNGFSTQSRERQAAASFQARMSDLSQQRRTVEEEARLAWFELQTARERVALLENAVNIANEVFEARRRLREAGRETVINVLDAQSEVFSTESQFITADADAKIASYRLLRAVGQLELDRIN